MALAGLAGAVILAGLLAFTNREPLLLDHAGRAIPDRSLTERMALLAPSVRFLPPPDASPPYPAVIQFHGCAGMGADFMEQWAAIAHRAGYMAVIVDSNTPRGVDRAQALETICKGRALIGQERAGDVLAAWRIVSAREDVDAARIVLAGWSHGAWSIMDLFGMNPAKRAPAGIAQTDTFTPSPAGAVLFYPYCGPGAWARAAPGNFVAALRAPSIAFVAGMDTVVDGPQCRDLFRKLAAKGAPVDMTYYPEADHVFDNANLAPEHMHYFDPDAAADAGRRVEAFLIALRDRTDASRRARVDGSGMPR